MRQVACIVAMVACSAALAQDYAYNTFAPNFGYETLAGSTVSGATAAPGYTDTANRFVSLLSGNITELIVAMSHNGQGPNSFDINLRADNNNSPGDVIHTWTIANQAFVFDGLYHEPVHVPVVDSVALVQGTAYWLDMHATESNSWMVWHFTRPPIFETVAQRTSAGGAWNVLQPGFTSAYAVVVPGPGVMGLLGIAGLAAARRKR